MFGIFLFLVYYKYLITNNTLVQLIIISFLLTSTCIKPNLTARSTKKNRKERKVLKVM